MTQGLVLPLVLVAATCLAAQRARPEEQKWTEARERMVQQAIIAEGITDERIVRALRTTPRHLFVPPSQQHLAYYDMALPIGSGQTISPPYIVAFMTLQLDPQPTDRVLEIGTGSGYQAAVLSPLVKEVYSIEIVEELGRKAAETLRKLNYTNVHTRIGDGFQGWPEKAPFDKIIVTCSPEHVPQPLVDQLRDGGRMVVPLGERFQQTLYLLRKEGDQLRREVLEPTFFVPMTGRAEALRQIKDTGLPQLVNGSFEAAGDDGRPTGWYYVRQARVVQDDQAPDGRAYLQLENHTPGRGAQALQSLAMDGRKLKHVEVAVQVAARGVRAGGSRRQLPRVQLNFFDEQRALVGTANIGPWYGTRPWGTRRTRIRVPVRSRLCVVAVAMFGATGQLCVDGLTIRPVLPEKP